MPLSFWSILQLTQERKFTGRKILLTVSPQIIDHTVHICDTCRKKTETAQVQLNLAKSKHGALDSLF